MSVQGLTILIILQVNAENLVEDMHKHAFFFSENKYNWGFYNVMYFGPHN